MTRTKRWLFTVLTAGLVVFFAEAAAFMLLRVLPVTVAPVPPAESALPTAAEGYQPGHILHPFLGFVGYPGRPLPDSPELGPTNAFGLFGPVETGGRPGRLVVAVTGGSVAMYLYQERDTLRTLISRAVSGRDVVLMFWALGGRKQPEQLFTLNYFLALGIHPDVVVNLDGFNEIVLPLAENLPAHVFPAFPRSWQFYTQKTDNPGVLALYGQVAAAEQAARSWSEWLKISPYARSNTVRLVSTLAEAHYRRTSVALERQLLGELRSSATGVGPQAIGPPFDPDPTSVRLQAVAVWERASALMEQLSRANGIVYLHFLQPNQYVPNSKSFSRLERDVAIGPVTYDFRQNAEIGFPLLIARIPELRQQGVDVTDLTMMFRQEERPVYRDTCCHLNALGNRRLAEVVAAGIVRGVTAR